MSEEKYIAIGTIDLQSSEIGKDINARFGSIDKNFKQIIEGEYLKGASGRDINIACCEFKYDPESQPTPLKLELYIDGISQPLTDKSIGQIIYEAIEDKFKSEVSDTLGAVEGINWYDNLNATNEIDNLNATNEIYLVYETDAVTGKNIVISSLPYIHTDARFIGENLSLLVQSGNRNLVDTSCNIIFSNNQFQVVQSSPTLYFNDILDEFCWKINGQETDLIARGPKGESFDTNSKLTCVKLEAETLIIDGAEYYKVQSILADYYDGSNPGQPQKYGFVTDIDANILPNPLGVPVYGIFREIDQVSYFFSSMFNMNIKKDGENYIRVSVDEKEESVWVIAKDSVLTLEGGMLKEGLYHTLKNNFAKDYKEFCGDQKVGMIFLPQNPEGTQVHAIYNGNIANNGKDFPTSKNIINISPLQFGDETSIIPDQKLNIDYDTTIKNLNVENITSSSLQAQNAEVDKINAVNIDVCEINVGTIINTPEINVDTIINTPEINVGVITNKQANQNDITLHLELGTGDNQEFIPGFKINCTKYYDNGLGVAGSTTRDIFTIGNGGSSDISEFFTPEFNFKGNVNAESINVSRRLNVSQELNVQDLTARGIECDGLTTTDLNVNNIGENTQQIQISEHVIGNEEDAPVTKDLVDKLEENLYIPEPIIQIIDRVKIINDPNWDTTAYENGQDSYPILAIGSSAAHGQISYTQIGEAMDNQLMLVHFGFGVENVTSQNSYPAKLTRKYADIALLLRTLEQFITDVCSGEKLDKSKYLNWILEKYTGIVTAKDYIR